MFTTKGTKENLLGGKVFFKDIQFTRKWIDAGDRLPWHLDSCIHAGMTGVCKVLDANTLGLLIEQYLLGILDVLFVLPLAELRYW